MSIVLLTSASAATYDTKECAVGGTVVTSTSNLKYGVRNLKVSSESEVRSLVSVAQSGRITGWFYQETAFPSADALGYICLIGSTEVNYILQVGYDTSTGKLALRNYQHTTIAVGSTVLSVNTHYRLAMSYVVNSDVDWDVKVYLATADGTAGNLEINVSDLQQLALGTVGKVAQGQWTNASGFVYYSPLYADDVTDLSDPGDIRVTPALYTGVVTNQFDGADGGNGAVNERPLSETNYKLNTGATSSDQLYNIQAASACDVDVSSKTIVGYQGWVWAKVDTGTQAADLFVAGNTATPTLTATPAYYYHPVTSSSYPTAGLFGMGASGGTADTYFYEGGALIAYDEGSEEEPAEVWSWNTGTSIRRSRFGG